MDATYERRATHLTFPPQVPFSWTLRWARARRHDRTAMRPRAYRIAGSAANDRELAAVVAFCKSQAASLELEPMP